MQKQKYTSKCTDVNGRTKTIPHLFSVNEKYCMFLKGDRILDLGSGAKTDHIAKYLGCAGIEEYYPWDPYNKPEETNKHSLEQAPFNVITISNVLNVIDSKDARQELLKMAWTKLTQGGWLYITIYEGNKSGIMRLDEKRDSCQLNQRLPFYQKEIEETLHVDFEANGKVIDKVLMIHKRGIV